MRIYGFISIGISRQNILLFYNKGATRTPCARSGDAYDRRKNAAIYYNNTGMQWRDLKKHWQISEFQFPKPYFQPFCLVKYRNQAKIIYFSVVVCLRYLLHILSLIAYTYRENRDFVFITIVQFMLSSNIIRLFVHNTISLSSLCKLIWRHLTYKMPVRYILSSVWVRLSIFSQLSIIQYMGLCVFSLPISLVMIKMIYTLSYCPACRTTLIATRFWVVMICPIIKCLTILEFSFILFDLCLFITIINFILNYVPIVTFLIFTYHKIWILLIIFCFIWSYWIIYFLTCLEVFWSVVR